MGQHCPRDVLLRIVRYPRPGVVRAGIQQQKRHQERAPTAFDIDPLIHEVGRVPRLEKHLGDLRARQTVTLSQGRQGVRPE